MRDVWIDWPEAVQPSRFTRLEFGKKEFVLDWRTPFLPHGIESLNADMILSESIACRDGSLDRVVTGFCPNWRGMSADR